MRRAFADTAFFVAFLNENDELHRAAMLHASDASLHITTTDWVLLELANWFAASAGRSRVKPYIDSLSRQPSVTIIRAVAQQFDDGLALYHGRPDKTWSLTDCISFTVMRQLGLTDALTADHHFEQAGFRALLR